MVTRLCPTARSRPPCAPPDPFATPLTGDAMPCHVRRKRNKVELVACKVSHRIYCRMNVSYAPIVFRLCCVFYGVVSALEYSCEAGTLPLYQCLCCTSTLVHFTTRKRTNGVLAKQPYRVMTGRNRNAFCAVRPPGHHAGTRGLVTCGNDTQGSHGFCLLNNVVS